MVSAALDKNLIISAFNKVAFKQSQFFIPMALLSRDFKVYRKVRFKNVSARSEGIYIIRKGTFYGSAQYFSQ